ncbi:hypothetical protein QBC38DRAFT_468565 [Podospora fimiseda]|uniref:Uncharacterized protein n=1 Tax=Podospora fimiseda TaxID=252190 RepID=A0AAN7BWQ0_9PEZI|nr:hypothetical protein QBC38DRAFT_468565 [Podospora fimiseda]
MPLLRPIVTRSVCRALISWFNPSITTKPPKPREGGVWKLQKEEHYQMGHAKLSSSVYPCQFLYNHRTFCCGGGVMVVVVLTLF